MNNDSRKRIDSIKSTKKIISVMKQASVAKLKNIKANIVSSGHFLDELRLIAAQLLEHDEISKQIKFSPFFSDVKNDSGRIILFITSDKGLCGSYNSFAKISFDKTVKEDDKIICIGKKGLEHLSRNHKNIEIINYSCFSEERSAKPNLEASSKIASIIVDLFVKNNSRCISVSSHCIGGAAIKGLIEDIIPFSLKNIKYTKNSKEKRNKNNSSMLIVNPIQDVIYNFALNYMEFFIYDKLLDAMFAEESARAIAMENASKNSDSALMDLQIEFNRNRQAKITKEISEVINSSEFI